MSNWAAKEKEWQVVKNMMATTGSIIVYDGDRREGFNYEIPAHNDTTNDVEDAGQNNTHPCLMEIAYNGV